VKNVGYVKASGGSKVYLNFVSVKSDDFPQESIAECMAVYGGPDVLVNV